MENKYNIIKDLHKPPGSQHGAALLIMLVILIMGGTAMLLKALNSTTIRLERDKITAASLAQAKEALIGRAVSDPNRPGELPCPDIAGDGQLDLNVDFEPGGLCKQFVGYLPWKTLGLPELRDGTGVKLFYAVSKNFYAGSIAVLNSDTRGQLSILGDINQDNIAAIVFAPGAPLCSQSRSGNSIDQYLEAMSSVSATSAVAQTNSNDCADSPYNDNFLAITADHILQPIEKRIAREAKSCLDDYAAISANKYPWAAPVSSATYTSTSNMLFGRIPDQPTTITNSNITSMINAISALKAAVNNCVLYNNAANRSSLNNAGNILESAAQIVNATQPTSPAIPNSVTDPAENAGDKAQDSWRCENINNHPSSNIVQQSLDAANAALSGITFDMSPTWPTSCTLLSSSYWPDWKSLVFYQVSDGYRPMASSPACGTSCLSIIGTGNSNSGSGTYHAAVLLAGKKLASQTRNDPFANPPTDYLSNNIDEGSTVSGLVANAHDSAGTTTTFKTYNLSDPDNKNINDLILCLDGKNNCK